MSWNSCLIDCLWSNPFYKMKTRPNVFCSQYKRISNQYLVNFSIRVFFFVMGTSVLVFIAPWIPDILRLETAHFKSPLQNFAITYHLILEVHYFYHLLRKHLRRIFLEKHFLKYFNCLHDVYNFSLDIKASFFLFYPYNFN